MANRKRKASTLTTAYPGYTFGTYSNSNSNNQAESKVVSLHNVRDNADDDYEDDEDDYQASDHDAPKVKSFSTDIHVNGVHAGKIFAQVIDRDDLDGDNFHTICDEESGEFEQVGFEFCDSEGNVRIDVGDDDSDSGGFMYITSMKVDAEHKVGGATTVAAEALRLFLSHPKVADSWTLVVYIPEAEGWRDAKPGGHILGTPGHRNFIQRGQSADMRAFFRVGFAQPPGLGARVFLTPSLFCGENALKRSHADALAVAITPMNRSMAIHHERDESEALDDFHDAFNPTRGHRAFNVDSDHHPLITHDALGRTIINMPRFY
eukprot:m.94678 g.94678  ORF g.94678 m.94678 type:complete len:320 (+) comp26745_c0_seq1:175-1134(+)